jgi:hypothetical protein
MDRPGNEDVDFPHEEGWCLPVHGDVHYIVCGNLICKHYNRIQKCTVPIKSVYAACKNCGTLERITR